MTTSESKGRFFTKRIDSHNESNRELECSTCCLLASDRLAVVLSSYWYRLVICYFKWHYFKSEGRGPDLRKWRGPRMVALRVWSLVCLNTTVQNVRFSLTTTTRRRLKRAQTNATHTYSTQRAYTYIGLHVDAWRNRFILVMHEPQGLKKLWNFEARACIGVQKNLDFINKNVRLD